MKRQFVNLYSIAGYAREMYTCSSQKDAQRINVKVRKDNHIFCLLKDSAITDIINNNTSLIYMESIKDSGREIQQ